MNGNHADDEYLLKHDFNRLLTGKQPKFRRIIAIAVSRGFFGREESDDVLQEINTSLIGKKDRLIANYNGLSTVDAYLQVIVMNECRKYAGIRQVTKDFIQEISDKEHEIRDQSLPADGRYIIEDEAGRLHLILRLYPRQRFQIEFFFKADLPFSGRN